MHFSECVTEQAGLSLLQKRSSEVRFTLDLAHRLHFDWWSVHVLIYGQGVST